MVSVFDLPGRAWGLARKIEDLLALQNRTRIALEELNARVRGIEDRMTHLEANQGQLVADAKAAAGIAATGLASAVISDVVTRITRLEMRRDNIQRRLTPE